MSCRHSPRAHFSGKAASSDLSVSDLVDEAVRMFMQEDQEDQEDLEAIADRVSEPVVTYEALLKDLKKHGKI